MNTPILKTRKSILSSFDKMVTDLLAVAEKEDTKRVTLDLKADELQEKAENKRMMARASRDEAAACRRAAERIRETFG